MVNAETIANQFGNFPVLSPEVEAEINRLNRKPYIELDRVKECHSWMYELILSKMTGLLVGKSRCGKTVTCKSFTARYNNLKEGKKQRIKPVVYIQIPQNCGSRDFFIKILKALNKPTNGTISDLRERTLDSLEIYSCEMLIIDEANHLKPETFADVRHVYDEDSLNISVLLVGTTDRLEEVVKDDEQVANRFLEEYELDILKDPEFKKIVQIWERDVLRLPEPSNLAKAENLRILKKATSNLIGRLDMILRKAAIRALSQGEKCITSEILTQVINTTKWSNETKRKKR